MIYLTTGIVKIIEISNITMLVLNRKFVMH